MAREHLKITKLSCYFATEQLLCKDSSCVNGGTCVELGETYHCECPHGLTGQHCESNINDCHLDSCYNGGTCVDKLNGFSCLCSDGFEGKKVAFYEKF